MTQAPIALTMGDPAGIGLELALGAWRQGAALRAPFFLLADPDALARVDRGLGLSTPIETTTPQRAADVFAHALPVAPLKARASAEPGKPDPANAPAILESIERAVGYVRSGAAQRRRHQPDRQEDALRRRLRPSRPYRISRRARQGLGRAGDAGDDDLVAAARRRPRHHPHSAERGPRRADARRDRGDGAHRRPRPSRAFQAGAAAHRGRRAQSARRRGRRHRARGDRDHRPRRSRRCATRGSTSSAPCPPTPCSTRARARTTTSR